MLSLLTLTGGASLAGVWVYRRLGEKDPEPNWWQTSWQTIQETLHHAQQRLFLRSPRSLATRMADASPDRARPMDDPTATLFYGWHTSTLALGVTTTAWLVFPPLKVAGLPLLVYMGIPAAQAAYEQLWVDGRPSQALSETVVLAVCLSGGYYWVGALGFWLYYAGQRWLLNQQSGEVSKRPEGWLPTSTHLWQEGSVRAVPTATLQPGDQVILHSGELVPLDGLITEGMAWLQPQALSSAGCGLRKAVGDRVAATDIVLVGRICVRVLPAA